MQIKAKWGFKGDPAAVGNEDGRVLTGTVLTVDDKYGHHLIGASLAEPYGEEDQVAYQARVAAASADPDALAAAHADLEEREAALAVREADIERREAELDKAAADAAGDKAGDSESAGGKAPKETKPATSKETK